MLGAVRRRQGQVRLAAGRHQHREAAGGEAEGADALRVDHTVRGPGVQHVVDQHVELPWPIGHVGGPALVLPVVACVGQGGDYEPGPSQGQRRIVVPGVGAAVAVGDHHQGQSRSRHRTVRRHGLGEQLQRLGRGRGVGGIPDGDLYRRARAVRDAEALEAHGAFLGRRRANEAERHKQDGGEGLQQTHDTLLAVGQPDHTAAPAARTRRMTMKRVVRYCTANRPSLDDSGNTPRNQAQAFGSPFATRARLIAAVVNIIPAQT